MYILICMFSLFWRDLERSGEPAQGGERENLTVNLAHVLPSPPRKNDESALSFLIVEKLET